MISLGIDPSLRAYGWAVHDSESTGRTRRVSSGHDGTLPTIVPVARFMQFRTMVADLLDRHPKIQIVGIESPAYEAGPFQTVHFGLMMYALEAIFERRRDCVLFDPTTLKYLAKGDPKVRKGIMGKSDMQRQVQLDTMDSKVIDNNEADAYLIALFAARFAEFRSGNINPLDLTSAEHAVFIGRKRKIKTLTGTKTKRVAHVFRENSRYFSFSQIPEGSVNLPKRSSVDPKLLEYLEALESVEEITKRRE